MSDIVRRIAGVAPPSVELAGKTTKDLARLCHEAEDAGNDVLLCDVWSELGRREQALPGTERLFMDWYRLLWVERMEGAKKP